MQVVLFDDHAWRERLYPLSLTRPVSNLRVGILTINEKWEKWLDLPVSYLTADYLREKFPLSSSSSEVILIQGNLLPEERLLESIHGLKTGEVLLGQEGFLALKSGVSMGDDFSFTHWQDFKPIQHGWPVSRLDYAEDIFLNNGQEIKKDFELITKGRSSGSLSSTNTILGDQIFVEEGASAECSILNAQQGPIYLGKNSSIWEGSMVRGSFSLGENSQLKMGTKVYSNVSIGPYSRLGGELNTCVVWGNSAKGHDGYLGSSVLGEWCNWGAGTSCSNMKNTYKPIRLFDYETGAYRETGQDFCGLIMGDHSKCAINTSFNTGTVVGVSANVFGPGPLPTFIPDFSWGGGNDFSTYRLDKMQETAQLVFQRRNRKFDDVEKRLSKSIFNITKEHRNF